MAIDPRVLFVEMLNELQRRMEVSSHYELVRAMGLIRQLIVDGSRLVDLINRSHSIRLQFPIAQNRPIENGGNQIILRGFGGAEKPELIGLDGFLRYQCVNLRGEIFTVADVIRIASNKEGGVHYGADQDKREAELINFRVQAWGVEFLDGSGPGADVVAFAAQQIGFAVLEGLAEIKQAVRDELVRPET